MYCERMQLLAPLIESGASCSSGSAVDCRFLGLDWVEALDDMPATIHGTYLLDLGNLFAVGRYDAKEKSGFVAS